MINLATWQKLTFGISQEKFTQYIEEHKNHLTIYKLRNNIQITVGNFDEL